MRNVSIGPPTGDEEGGIGQTTDEERVDRPTDWRREGLGQTTDEQHDDRPTDWRRGAGVGRNTHEGRVNRPTNWRQGGGIRPIEFARLRLNSVEQASARTSDAGTGVGRRLAGPMLANVEDSWRQASRRPADVETSCTLGTLMLADVEVDWRLPAAEVSQLLN
ncbi:Hypothetical protein SMAX5B_003978 [Scophthalmus maximus]|uniref:Uncharacterized protein n=1 Tax=Scophthalmus maximus TaxID=52904 RepID=A0A2U9C7G8_SCOMX|nr:Hypothetical protein SMAX5B_003978 [Scophthalmus maximus]